MFKNILVPLDGSDNAYKTLEYAANLAEKYDSKINVLSVFRHHSESLSLVRLKEPENIDDVSSSYTKDIVAQGKTTLEEHGVEKIRGFIKMGRASKKILEFAKKHEIDLIIISSKGHGDLTGYLLGGVSHKVAGLAKCPVMVIN